MSRLAWFKFYYADFYGDGNVQRMSLAEEAAYIRLLSLQWQIGYIPSCEKELAKLIGVPLNVWRKMWPAIERCFELDGEFYVQKRMRAEHEKVERETAKKRAGGLKGAKARWHSHAEANGKNQKPEAISHIVPPSAGAGKVSKVRPKPSSAHVEVRDFWMDLWLEVRGEPYAFAGVKDGSALKTCLKYAKGDVELVKERMRRILEDPPDAWTAQAACLGILVSKWNSLGIHIVPVSEHERQMDLIINGPPKPKADCNESRTHPDLDAQSGPTTMDRFRRAHQTLGNGPRPSTNGHPRGSSLALPPHAEGLPEPSPDS